MTSAPVKHKCASWDFRGANTKEYTHRFHNYPAMMVPQVARRLLERYGTPGGWLLDPYCGTGTSLVEASLFGMNAVGCDINPLARLIARAKTAPMRPDGLDALDARMDAMRESLGRESLAKDGQGAGGGAAGGVNGGAVISANGGVNDADGGAIIRANGGVNGVLPDCGAPPVLNREYWFSDSAARQLTALRRRILAEPDAPVRRFFWVAFSETVRDCSYTKNGEYKLVRMAADRMADFKPDAAAVFLLKLARNRAGLSDYLALRRDADIRVMDCNTAKGERPGDRKFDLAITSPPYGDSATTVAYGQFSRLSAQWIGLPDAKVDRASMGGVVKDGRLGDCPATDAVGRVRDADPKRARQVETFYMDLGASARSVAAAMSDRAVVCYVVGNRTVKGVALPTDEFVADAFERRGFRHIETIVRNIPNKRMPARNSPSNVAGKTAATMREERVVICRRGAA